MTTANNSPCVIIDPNALKHNFELVANLAPQSKILAVVKANAYGHGLNVAHQAFADADGYGVARLCEAEQLRLIEPHKPIIVFSESWQAKQLTTLRNLRLSPVIFDPSHFDLFNNSGLNCWIHLDTGMHRSGLMFNKKTENNIKDFIQNNHVTLMSHFAESEITDGTFTGQQLNLFNQTAQLLTNSISNTQDQPCKITCSIANSGAVLQHPQSHLDWVRPGIMLYGANPAKHISAQLKPAMQLNARVISTRTIAAGETVGYNRKWKAEKESVIANVNIGYADGYPRQARSGTPVWINGKTWPIVGSVSMDSLSVDISGSDIKIGDIVELWGENLDANIVADYCNTISYDLFTGVAERVNRIIKSQTF